MSSGMFLIQADGQLVEMSEQPYHSEDLLQELLAKYPNLMAGDQIDDTNPRRWLLISREAALPSEENGANRWSVDHLFLDQDAIPTIVEVKKSSNTDVRRKVVGQMLDYAANAVVYWPIDEIQKMFEATCRQQGIDPQLKIEEFLNASDDQEVFWQKAKANLLEGKIRMLFVADEIPVELRRIVEFLNSQMYRAEVLAVEIKQFVGQNQRSLIPRVIGQTEEATAKKEIRTKKQWDWDSFSKDLESRRGPDEVDIAKKILEWTKDKLPRLLWGKGNFDGSFFPILDYNGIDYYPIAIWSYGKIEIQFKWLQRRPPFDAESKRKELLDRLNQIPGFDIPIDAIARFPKVDLSALKNEDSLKQFLDVLDWVVQEAKKS
ncbi:MAG: hypothetical protein GYA38_10120 [Chloroflexi bacterium]|nr:hypothetical protein [Chloroflexota bacterium]